MRHCTASPMAIARGMGLACLLCFAAGAQGTEAAPSLPDRWTLDLDFQRVDTSTNAFRRGAGYSGTQIESTDYTGHRASSGRAELVYAADWLGPDDQLRFVVAPVRASGTATAPMAIRFDGASFAAGTPLSVTYKFNTYRVTYDVPVLASLRARGWDLRLGGTLAIRDARTLLSQPGVTRNFYNWGPVPLLYFSAAVHPAAGWELGAQFDAFPAPGGGGLIDASLLASYALTRGFALTAGGRYVDGGATSPDFYNHLRQRVAVAGIRVRF